MQLKQFLVFITTSYILYNIIIQCKYYYSFQGNCTKTRDPRISMYETCTIKCSSGEIILSKTDLCAYVNDYYIDVRGEIPTIARTYQLEILYMFLIAGITCMILWIKSVISICNIRSVSAGESIIYYDA